MTLDTQHKSYSLEEYLALEEVAEYKNEFHNGKIIPMSGAKFNHNLIATNFTVELGILIKTIKKDLIVLNSDMKVWIPERNSIFYPDALVISKPPKFYKNRKDVLTNPLVIVEVLSPSTKKFDQNEKFEHYKTIEGFEEYVLVHSEKTAIQVFTKNNNQWIEKNYLNLEDILKLEAIQIELNMKDIYSGVEF